ncbi:MAG: GNAT family N-acetyltransferase [Paraclostridium sp.]|uniref:GNAT family N-acetyltransferase n=1 Tax=Paraclostridium sp. TaxID=2023273 RepID=UPI003F41AA6E
MVKLKDYKILTDGKIDIVLQEKREGDDLKGFSPEYKFKVLLHNSDKIIGHINLKIGNIEKVVKYIGYIGYAINEEYRGNKYSAKACSIIKEVAKENRLDSIIITCNPDNYASRRVCEYIDANLIEIIDIPKTSDAYSLSETKKCRYEWK